MNSIDIARPYAKALFELAYEQSDLKSTADFLMLMSAVAEDHNLRSTLMHPDVSKEVLVSIFLNVAKKSTLKSIVGERFIELLAQRKRLQILPFILKLFNEMRYEAEQVMPVLVKSAHPVNEEMADVLAQALKNKFKREITLSIELDEALIGGAVVYAQDIIIDGSVKGKLTQLANALIV